METRFKLGNYYMDSLNKYNTGDLSRRHFMKSLAASGLGLMGLSSFLQSCAEKEITIPPTDLAQAYIRSILDIIGIIRERELQKIVKAANLAVQAKHQGQKLYTNITGAIFPQEIDITRPGSPNLFLMEDSVSKN